MDTIKHPYCNHPVHILQKYEECPICYAQVGVAYTMEYEATTYYKTYVIEQVTPDGRRVVEPSEIITALKAHFEKVATNY